MNSVTDCTVCLQNTMSAARDIHCECVHACASVTERKERQKIRMQEREKMAELELYWKER